jgi:succinate dehydrogenase / fumarate reductase iron-sulfur subunit
MNDSNATVKLYRFDPTVDKGPRYETYEVPAEAWNKRKVVDVLRYIYENFAPGLAFREPCRQQLCGACLVMVNKKPVMACEAVAEQEMTIEPPPKRKVLKDLIVEMPFSDE